MYYKNVHKLHASQPIIYPSISYRQDDNFFVPKLIKNIIRTIIWNIIKTSLIRAMCIRMMHVILVVCMICVRYSVYMVYIYICIYI